MEKIYAGRRSARQAGRFQIMIQRNRRQMRPRSAAGSYTPRLLFAEPPLPGMQACVIVPAKNESENITRTLRALHYQRDEKGQPLPFSSYEILLLVNNCTDDTYEVASAYAQQHPELQLHIAQIKLPKKEAHIGTARRLLMDEAFRRHGINARDGVILSTDADTEADAQWIVNTLHEMKGGYDVVGGRILARDVHKGSKWYYLQDTAYRCFSARLEAMIDREEGGAEATHFQCFGASLAVRCSTYHRAGRLPVIPFLEDEAFSRALYRVDARIKRSSAVRVYTSSRLEGRVQEGLSVHLAHLARLKEHAVTIYVESLATLLEKFRIKKYLRSCWRLRKRKGQEAFLKPLHAVAATLQVSSHWLMREMDISRYFGEFWEKAEPCLYRGVWGSRQQKIRIGKAIEELRQYVNGEGD